uniref:Big_5 domain-containing protein n=1 Tax=Panagrellus redivivus TaxID=6233 RepID=A0A7E4V108_PANRE
MNVLLNLLILPFALTVLKADSPNYVDETNFESIKAKTGATSAKLENGQLVLELSGKSKSTDDIYLAFPKTGVAFDVLTPLTSTFEASTGQLFITMSTSGGKTATAKLEWQGRATTFLNINDISVQPTKQIGRGDKDTFITTLQIDSNGALSASLSDPTDEKPQMVPLIEGDSLDNNADMRVFLFRFEWDVKRPFQVTFKSGTKLVKKVAAIVETTTTTTTDSMITEVLATKPSKKESKTGLVFIIIAGVVAFILLITVIVVTAYLIARKIKSRSTSKSKNKTTSSTIPTKSKEAQPFKSNKSATFDLNTQPTLQSEEVFQKSTSVKVTFKPPPHPSNSRDAITDVHDTRDSDAIGSLKAYSPKKPENSDVPTARPITFVSNVTSLRLAPDAPSAKTAIKVPPKASGSKVDLVEPKLEDSKYVKSVDDKASVTGTSTKTKSKTWLFTRSKKGGSKEASKDKDVEKGTKTAKSVVAVDGKGKASEEKV